MSFYFHHVLRLIENKQVTTDYQYFKTLKECLNWAKKKKLNKVYF